jgi:hypothetical protein
MKELLEVIVVVLALAIGFSTLIFGTPWLAEAASYNAKAAACYFNDYKCEK